MKEKSEINILNINGIRVLHIKNKSFLTNLRVLTNVGSSAEEENIYGMAHILEHMFFKGSKKRPGSTAISRAANDIGGKLNAYTSYDHTAYYITVLNDKFKEGADILFDMYLNPTFPPEELKKELKPILSEYREREDDPEGFLMERALEKYMGASYHPIIGNEETIKSATVEAMRGFKNRFYGGQNCMITVVGGIDETEVTKIVTEKFQFSDQTQPADLKKPEFVPGEIVLKKPGIQEAYCNLFYPALSHMHPDRYKQDIMCYILGGNDSAMLYERIREELGLSCYGVYSWIMRYEPFSLLGIGAGIAPDEIDIYEKEVHGQIERICSSLVDEQSLLRARASLRTSIAARSETSSGLASLVGVPILKGETEHPVEKALEEIEKVTVQEIMDFAQKTFSEKPFRAVLLPEN